MNISVITLFPELYTSFLQTSLIKRALEQEKVSIDTYNLFSYTQPKQRVDAPTFGHSAGMILKPEIVQAAVEDVEQKKGKALKIFLSPQGKKMNQMRLQALYERMQQAEHTLFFASRYEGVDARVEEEYADELISVGDFVVMGGDIPTMLLLEGLLRFVPGVVGRQESVALDSFSGPLVDHPEYTKPVEWKDRVVPEIVRSGDHAQIAAWRKAQALQKTVVHHFEWLRSYPLEQKDIMQAAGYIPSHYVVLMHDQIIQKDKRIGTTSVTPMDIHDIARSSKTYGIKKYFIVTPLKDQQAIVQTLLGFWHDAQKGMQYNTTRHEALEHVQVCTSLQDVVTEIERLEKACPLLIGTSAKPDQTNRMITYFDQEKVWEQNRPVLFVFGTGHGLSHELMQTFDYILLPVQGFTQYNHLSVRSAVAIILDKWMGLAQKA